MTVILQSAARSKQWIELYERQAKGLPIALAPLFAGFRSSLDVPSSNFVPQLAKEFPDAKVVLSYRSGESWAESTKVFSFHFTWSHCIATYWDPESYWQNVLTNRHIFPEMARVYGCPFGSAEMMEKHTAGIKAAIPAERLLIFRVEEGWEPLCSFLGVPIPDVPFPRKNDKAQLLAMIAKMRKAGWWNPSPSGGSSSLAAERPMTIPLETRWSIGGYVVG
ncbi:hypothetical protein RQP46_011402 [Phenoliferia psychrophenolica]